MSLTITPAHPEVAHQLLAASHALMASLFPSESNHYLSLDKLAGPDIKFLVACEGEDVLGCGALVIKPGYGEVKSMFTAEKTRGVGIADAVLRALTDVAQIERLPLLRLETGGALAAAHRLYERHGFMRRGPFGDYPNDPLSVFFEKAL